MKTDKIFKKVFDHIEKEQLLTRGDRIIAGVSGGADSMCMLIMLLELRKIMGTEVIVAHVDHGIRGAEAERDAEFVREFCQDMEVPFEIVKADIPALAKETGTTCEEAGRNFRYRYFASLAKKLKADKIAVAHNCDDNAETILFNIFRGSGIGGLRGILPKRSIKTEGSGNYTLIRPVLVLSRQEIEEYLKEKKQPFCIDSTNSEEAYSRNKIRNSILPMARDGINANINGHLEALSRQAAEVLDFLEAEIEKHTDSMEGIRDASGNLTGISMDLKVLEKLHPVIVKRLIRKAFEKVAGRLKDVEEVHILDIAALAGKQSGRRISLPYGITAVKEQKELLLTKAVEETCEEGLSNISLEIFDRKELPTEIPREEDVKWFDNEKTGGWPVLRFPKEGDYLLIGKELHKKSLNRFMIDRKIPMHLKGSVPVLAVGSHVLWVVGYRQDDSALISEVTKQVLVAKRN